MALRYFSLGNITFTDEVGTTIRDFPAELSLDGGFLQKFLSDSVEDSQPDSFTAT